MSTALKQVDPATGVTELGYNRYIVEKVIEKVHRIFGQIENRLQLKFEYKLVLTDHGHLSINGVNNHVISSDPWITSKGIQEMNFRCSGFPFTLRGGDRSKLSISFNKYFDIEVIHFTCMSKKANHYEKIDVRFDKNIELESINFNPNYPQTDTEVFKSVKHNNLLSFDDEVILFQLSQNTSVEIKELIPEYHIPAAYDFSSQDFADRFKVFSMLTL
jgi:hypothetical protein